MSGSQRIRALALATAAQKAKRRCISNTNSSGDGICAEIDDILKTVST